MAHRKEEEFARVSGITYLDHAGATLYSEQQLRAYADDLASTVYGNPHSHNPSSILTTECIEHVRELVLKYFDTGLDQYDVIFTSGCTGALKLLAENFPWTGRTNHNGDEEEVMYIESLDAAVKLQRTEDECRSVFCYLEDNHTSVLGMREVVSDYGAGLACVSSACMEEATMDSGYEACSDPSSDASSSSSLSRPLHLFAYPAQSNFNGRKYPLSWINDISAGHMTIPGHSHIKGSWLVALDAAALVGTSPLNLSDYPAHFVTISFYKIFGFPTGLGALLVRRDCCSLLGEKKRGRYFGGGTVLASIASQRYHLPRPEAHDRLEHGTLPFLDILAVRHGFESLKRTPYTVSQRTFFLAGFTYSSMSDLKHSNGQPVCVLYHKQTIFVDHTKQGGVVTFNLKRPDGSYVGYSEVDKLASANNIHVRTGCFCNPGACQRALGLTNDQIMRNIQAGHHCGDNIDLVDGRPTGCVRISFGNMSIMSDAKKFIAFVKSCFVDLNVGYIKKEVEGEGGSVGSSEAEIAAGSSSSAEGSYEQVISCGDSVSAVSTSGTAVDQVLVKLVLYPVKSCSGFSVKNWPIGPKGLLYDREWMIVSDQGVCMSQKQEPAMALLLPHVDLNTGTLTLTKKDSDLPELVIHTQLEEEKVSSDTCHTRVCGDRVQGCGCGQEVSEWLTKALGKSCKLVRQGKEERRKDAGGVNVPLSLTNKAQYLMVTLSSIKNLHEVLSQDGKTRVSPYNTQNGHPTTTKQLSIEDLLQRFRPNLVVKQKDDSVKIEPFDEDNWTEVTIGQYSLQVVEKCSRCQMVCIDQSTGARSSQPLKSLLALRGSKAHFGIYLATKAT